MKDIYEQIEPDGRIPLSPGAAPDQTHVPREDKQAVRIIRDTLAQRQSARDTVHRLVEERQGRTLSNDPPTGLQSAAAEIFRDAPLIVD
jgi:hypothetical protein